MSLHTMFLPGAGGAANHVLLPAVCVCFAARKGLELKGAIAVARKAIGLTRWVAICSGARSRRCDAILFIVTMAGGSIVVGL